MKKLIFLSLVISFFTIQLCAETTKKKREFGYVATGIFNSPHSVYYKKQHKQNSLWVLTLSNFGGMIRTGASTDQNFVLGLNLGHEKRFTIIHKLHAVTGWEIVSNLEYRGNGYDEYGLGTGVILGFQRNLFKFISLQLDYRPRVMLTTKNDLFTDYILSLNGRTSFSLGVRF